MKIRATNSMDGKKRFVIQVEFRIGLDTLESALLSLVLAADEDDEGAIDEVLKAVTRASLVAHLKETLRNRGSDFEMSIGDHFGELGLRMSRPNIEKEVEGRVRALFPELA